VKGILSLTAAAALWFGLTLMVSGQPQQPQADPSSVIVPPYLAQVSGSFRLVQTRADTSDGEVVTQTIELKGPDGRFSTFRRAVTETAGTGTNSVHTNQKLFGTDASGRLTLIEATQTDEQILADGTSRRVESTSLADGNGRLELSEQTVIEERSIGPNVRQTDISISRPGLNDPIQEVVRIQETERQLSSNVFQNESVRLIRGGNSQWSIKEKQVQEVRKTTENQSNEDLAIHHLDLNGVLYLTEKVTTLRTSSPGRDEIVTERYTPDPTQTIGRLRLYERTRTTTTRTSDGGHQTIQEVERPNPGAPHEAFRLEERNVETLRSIGPDLWEMQQQLFRLDLNGRLVQAY